MGSAILVNGTGSGVTLTRVQVLASTLTMGPRTRDQLLGDSGFPLCQMVLISTPTP